MQLNLLTTLALLSGAGHLAAAAPRPDPNPNPNPAPKYDASVRDDFLDDVLDSGVITALFRDSHDAESRAEFKIGKWAFAGCESFSLSLSLPVAPVFQPVCTSLVFPSLAVSLFRPGGSCCPASRTCGSAGPTRVDSP